MNEQDNNDLGKLLRDAFPANGDELKRDLWPAMLRRMESSAPRIPWYDWVLGAGAAAGLAAFPGLLVVLAYHI